jgi:hypothetical protein
MTLTYRRLRAPGEDGQSLEVPATADFALQLQRNQQLLASHSFAIAGQPVETLRKQARRQLIDHAREYSQQYRDVCVPVHPRAMILAGHQPTLFHPGVWYKNFVLQELAERTDAVAINLVIDNDHDALRAIPVPTGGIDDPRLQLVRYDSGTSAGPFETEQLGNRQVFESFASQVQQTIRPFVPQPLIRKLWPFVTSALDELFNPSAAIAAGRHRLEADYGLQHLELPVSRICQTTGFAAFAVELLERAREFRTIHNRQLYRYRQLHRIRSNAHPVPGLREMDGWMESPLWVWNESSQQRRPLFVKSSADGLVLGDHQRLRHKLDRRQPVASFRELESLGIHVRPRALATTMYSRLVLSDAFVHGIGGGKYDQLTDEIIREFFQAEPPQFNIVTATCRLPVSVPWVSESEVTRQQVLLREIRFHPENFVDRCDRQNRQLVARKARQLQKLPPRGSRKAWHDELQEINEKLLAPLTGKRETLRSDLASMQHQVKVSQLLGSREYSFCLFDERLPGQLQQLARQPARQTVDAGGEHAAGSH